MKNSKGDYKQTTAVLSKMARTSCVERISERQAPPMVDDTG